MTWYLTRILHTVADTVPANTLLFGFWLAGFTALLIAFGVVIATLLDQADGRSDSGP